MEVIFVLKISTGQFSIVNYGQYPCESILKSLISVQAKKKKKLTSDTHLFHAVLNLSFTSNCFISLDYQGILIYVIEARLKKLGGEGGKLTVEKGTWGIELMENLECVVFPGKFEPSAFQMAMASSNGNRLCEGTPIYRTNLDSPGVESLS